MLSDSPKSFLLDPENNVYVDPSDYRSVVKYEEAIQLELDEGDYYTKKNVPWVSALAQWKTLRDSAKLATGTQVFKEAGTSARSYKITSSGKLIEDALEAEGRETTMAGW